MRRIGEYAAKGLDHASRELRFVTWTLKYNRCHWLELLGLNEHYARAEIIAKSADDGAVDVSLAKNITRFAIHPPMLTSPAQTAVAERNRPAPAQRRRTSRAGVRTREWKWKFAGASVVAFGQAPRRAGRLTMLCHGVPLRARIGQP
jgi:hypothetical protein